MTASATPSHATSESATLDVGGMTCAACQSNVQRALERQPGVREATVNLVTGEARIRFDPLAVTTARLVEAIESVGYDARVADRAARPAAALETALQPEETGARAAVALVLGAVSMLLSMPTMAGHASTHGDGPADPLMQWVSERMTPLLSALIPALYGVRRETLLLVLFGITVFVMGWAGRRLYVAGFRALRHGAPEMNSLVAVGTTAAFAFSAVATFWPEWLTRSGIAPDVYYEAVVIIVAFVLTGRWLESRARKQAVAALQGLARLQPRTALVVHGRREEEQPVERVALGDVVLVRPGGRVPLDGVVVDGRAAVDESSVTGESLPVSKSVDDRVTAGTMVADGALHVRVTATAGSDTVSRLVELMRDAQLSRAPIQRLADRVSAVFVPTVLALALATLAGWWAFGGTAALPRGLAAAVAVLIVACPCAMGLAVPTAVLVATGRGSALGLMVKGGEALQRASDLRTIVLDKTGTLTSGRPMVVEVASWGGASWGDALWDDASWDVTEARVVRVAAALERLSEHPLAKAIVAFGQAHEQAHEETPGQVPGRGQGLAVREYASEAGFGVTGLVGDRRAWVGKMEWLLAEASTLAQAPVDAFVASAAARGATVVGVAFERNGQRTLVGAFALADAVRESSARAVAEMVRAGLEVVMLSGDRDTTARAVAAQVGIEHVIAGVTPAGKVTEVERLRSRGPVGMVGDGVNDAPALARADVGFAMGSGVDVAVHASDVTLMRPDLRLVTVAVRLARAAMRVMRQNLFWAFAYNVLAIPLAAGLFYPAWGLLLSPTIASAAMALSSVSVVANSLRLRRIDIGM